MLKDRASVMGPIDTSQAAVDRHDSSRKLITYIVIGAHAPAR